MKMKLAENIRTFRKNKNMTQEQLAEILNVTVGAVSKWESAATTPELSMLMELADFFETSVDVLLGYQCRSLHRNEVLQQMEDLKNHKNYEEALEVGENAFKKFPNDFDIVYQTALIYLDAGFECNKAYVLRAKQLFERSLELVNQSNDPHFSQWEIKNKLAKCYLNLREAETALEIYQENNFAGIHDAIIAEILSDILKRGEESIPYVRTAFRRTMESLTANIIALGSFYYQKHEVEKSNEAILWLISVLESLRPDSGCCDTDKNLINLLAVMAESYWEQKDICKTKECLYKACKMAKDYDKINPQEICICRFLPEKSQGANFYDFGNKALSYLEGRMAILQEESPEFYALWQKVKEEYTA